jgi:UDP-4-amino-4,6-dideoxy-N-acetyl-beta-L-altrosamine transaminase
MIPVEKKIPYGLHWLDEDDIQAVVEVLRNGPITQGDVVQEFGEALANYVGADYCVAVSSGTAALHLAVTALGIGPGDEVITTPLTFCATANAALYQGAEVRFVDIDEKTLNLNPYLIEQQITDRTKAIMPVDFRGHPADLPQIKEIADKHGLKVIEDGSHSIGSNYTHKGQSYSCGDGVHADLCAFSFHPVKHITTGEGGAILGNDPELYERLTRLRQHGIVGRKEMFSEEKRVGNWIYDMEELGFNYRITDFQAALGISQLKKLDQFKSRRREIVNYYNESLDGIEEFILPHEEETVDSNFHLYVLQVKEDSRFDRYDFFSHLQSLSYLPMVHYIPVHLLKYYRDNFGFRPGDFPIAEKVYSRAVSIPLYPSMTDAEVEKTINDIKDFVASS